MSVLSELQAHGAAYRRALAELDPGRLRGEEAVSALGEVSKTERAMAAMRLRLVHRIEETNAWVGKGHKTPGYFIAAETGTTVGEANAALDTAAKLETAGATAEALKAGKVSEAQAAEIARAAAADPNCERTLIDEAPAMSVKELKDKSLAIQAAATDEDARQERIKQNRHLRTWTDKEGAGCGSWRTTPDRQAMILAALEAQTGVEFDKARAEDRRESLEAYAMDALDSLLTGGAQAASTKVNVEVVVDHPAIVRGHTEVGERCEVPGVGPVPVSVVKEWLSDAFLRLLVTDGIDIRAVTRSSRYIDPAQAAAVRVRDKHRCVVPGCANRRRLQRDHRHDHAKGGPTCVDNLELLCPFHHRLKTVEGWVLLRAPNGGYVFLPPAGDEERAPP